MNEQIICKVIINFSQFQRKWEVSVLEDSCRVTEKQIHIPSLRRKIPVSDLNLFKSLYKEINSYPSFYVWGFKENLNSLKEDLLNFAKENMSSVLRINEMHVQAYQKMANEIDIFKNSDEFNTPKKINLNL